PRQDDAEPAETNWQTAKMAHIRIHRLPAGDGEEDRTEHGKRNARWRLNEVGQRVMRAHCAQDFRGARYSSQTEQANRDEPQQHYRTKNIGYEHRPLSLDQE